MKPAVLGVVPFLAVMVIMAQPLRSQEGGGWRQGLAPVPEVDLGSLESSVAEQLEEMRELLARMLADEEVSEEELGRAFGEVGRTFHAYGFGETALACYRNARRLTPEDFRWAFYSGHLHEAAGRLDAAADSYGEALDLAPDRVGTLIRLGEVEAARNRLGRAEEALRRALALDPDAAAAMAVLGEVQMSRRHYAKAIESFEAALELIPSADRLHYPLAIAYRQLGDVEAARDHLELRGTVGLRHPDPLLEELDELLRGETVHVLRGRMAYRVGRYEDAVAEFREAVAARPESAGSRTNLGSALAGAGETDAAIEQFRRALELDPESLEARFNLGSLLAGRGDHGGAAEHLRAAVRLAPEDPEAHRELGDALRRLGRLEAALGEYEAALRLDPDDEMARFGKADAMIRQGRYGEGLEFLEHAIVLHPESMALTAALARVLAASPELDLRDGGRALELATRLFQATGRADHAEIVAMALAEEGRCADAAEWQRRVVEATRRSVPGGDVAALQSALERYREGPPCRAPGTL